jgi:hypothetical protein
VVDGVFGYFNHHITRCQHGLARQVSSMPLSDANPSRTITWQVVQAQLMSQACSSGILFSSKASQMEVPLGASIWAPVGQYSAWGNILMMGMNKLQVDTKDQ